MHDELCSFQFLMAQNHEPGVICNHVNVTTHKSKDVTKVGSDSGKPILGNGSRNAIITTADKIDQAVGNVLFDCDRLAPSRQIHQPNASQTTSNRIIFNHTQKETFHTKTARLTQSALESHCHPLHYCPQILFADLLLYVEVTGSISGNAWLHRRIGPGFW